MLDIKNLNYKIDNFSLSIDHLVIKNNSIHTLVGQSGSGKTTLINLIAGHLNPSSGGIHLNNKNIIPMAPHRRKIGLIFQQSLLFPNMNVFENIAYPLKIQKISPSKINKTVTKLLNKVSLSGFGNRMPDQLSGGQKKRVAIARTLATKPDILLMDEPLSSLDPQLKSEILGMILDLQKENNLSILFITHDFEEALKISDEISVIDQGQIIHTGPRHDLLFKPNSLKVMDFFPFFNKIQIKNNQDFFKAFEISYSKDDMCYIIPPQAIHLESGTKGEILQHYHLKYGNIYKIHIKNMYLYAFSKKFLSIGDKIDIDINIELINIIKEDT